MARAARATQPQREDNDDRSDAPAPRRNGATVVVASKLPMSIELQLAEKHQVARRFQGTTWTEDEWRRFGPVVTIRGTAYPRGQAPDGFRPAPEIVAGYAITRGVDAEFWRRWLEQNGTTEMVVNRVVFAGETFDEVRQVARKEMRDVRSGLDPIVPPKEGDKPSDRDPRLPGRIKGIEVTGEPGPTDMD